jgi:carboxyl-terminal processing protease
MKLTTIVLCLTICNTAAVLAQSGVQDQVTLHRECLDSVWQTVNDYHYDSTFGGLDWREIRERYDELVVAAKDDDALIKLLNDMLHELKLSHYAVFRKEAQAESGSPLFSEASVGIDLRLIGNEAVITHVNPDSPADRAGLKPGYMIRAINGVSVQKTLDDEAARPVPRFNERGKLNDLCGAIIDKCFGQPGDTMVLTYEDGAEISREARLQMQQRAGGTKIAEEFPIVYVDFRAERLPGNIGYIYFSSFMPPADSLFLAAMDAMSDARALIIDIRGNPGGSHELGETIASRLLSEKTLFSVFRYRDSTVQVSVEPDSSVFKGPVAILIDVMNGSASERFSACMQSIRRARIIGEQSPGSVGPSDLKRLPNGASFMFLVAQSLTPDGTVLEGRGVIPDFTVLLDRKALLEGVDTQIEQALAYLKSVVD